MRLLFLRGKVPTDRDPKQIMFNKLSENDDMWTQLAYQLTDGGSGQIWYWGGKRHVGYNKRFSEHWFPSFKSASMQEALDVIFARGGFPEYDVVLNRYKKAFKIYYGAGKRFYPQTKFKKYDLILVDTNAQANTVKSRFPNTRVELLIKPAADNIFKPIEGQKKLYDVIFVGNESKGDMKGHQFVLSRIPDGLKVLVVGIASKKLRRKYPAVTFTGWVPRKKIPKYYAQSKIAVIACIEKDSGPRVLVEAMACGCPVLIRHGVRCDMGRYANGVSGIMTTDPSFSFFVKAMVGSYEKYSPYLHYKNNFSLDVAARHIRSLINA